MRIASWRKGNKARFIVIRWAWRFARTVYHTCVIWEVGPLFISFDRSNNTDGALTTQIGDIGGLGDGDEVTVPAGTQGVWTKGWVYFR